MGFRSGGVGWGWLGLVRVRVRFFGLGRVGSGWVQIFHFPTDGIPRVIKGVSQKFSLTSLYRFGFVTCGKMKNFDFSRINPLCVQSV